MECHEWRIRKESMQRVIIVQLEVIFNMFKENGASCHRIDISQANTSVVTEFDSYCVCNSQSLLLLYCSVLDYH